MLVLSRQRNEIVRISDDVQIVIVDIRGDKVRLGIVAPSHVPIHREEVYQAVKRDHGAVVPGFDYRKVSRPERKEA
ncbi:MAG TPA: carbon storage regulator CsrA [Phycisphaerae bacterium]|nr:carbon storage regulator CsrA [Phycisphaerae bacterium]